MKIQVYEIDIKLFLLNNINYNNTYREITHFIDSCLAINPELFDLHNTNTFKNYTFNSFYPLEKDQVYKKDKIYSIQLRTIDAKLAEYFICVLKNHYTDNLKGLTVTVKIIPKKIIDNIYSITPVIIKNNDFGYWKDNISIIDYERRITENLIKKYNQITNSKIDENFLLFSSIEIINGKPIGFSYKGKKILGDKIKLYITNNETAQELAYMSLGTGIGEINARGAGFVNYKWV